MKKALYLFSLVISASYAQADLDPAKISALSIEDRVAFAKQDLAARPRNAKDLSVYQLPMEQYGIELAEVLLDRDTFYLASNFSQFKIQPETERLRFAKILTAKNSWDTIRYLDQFEFKSEEGKIEYLDSLAELAPFQIPAAILFFDLKEESLRARYAARSVGQWGGKFENFKIYKQRNLNHLADLAIDGTPKWFVENWGTTAHSVKGLDSFSLFSRLSLELSAEELLGFAKKIQLQRNLPEAALEIVSLDPEQWPLETAADLSALMAMASNTDEQWNRFDQTFEPQTRTRMESLFKTIQNSSLPVRQSQLNIVEKYIKVRRLSDTDSFVRGIRSNLLKRMARWNFETDRLDYNQQAPQVLLHINYIIQSEADIFSDDQNRANAKKIINEAIRYAKTFSQLLVLIDRPETQESSLKLIDLVSRLGRDVSLSPIDVLPFLKLKDWTEFAGPHRDETSLEQMALDILAAQINEKTSKEDALLIYDSLRPYFLKYTRGMKNLGASSAEALLKINRQLSMLLPEKQLESEGAILVETLRSLF